MELWRRLKADWVLYSLFRLNGWSRTGAILSIIANRTIGTKMYYYPPAKRRKLRAMRLYGSEEPTYRPEA